MAYTKQSWEPRTGEGLNRFQYNMEGGYITLSSSPIALTKQGTPITAARLNHMEDGIAAHSLIGGITPDSYFKNYGLSHDINSTKGSFSTARTDGPEGFVEVLNLQDDKFWAQLAITSYENTSATRESKAWIRDKYNTGVWSNWTELVICGGAQTISGVKTFTAKNTFGNNATSSGNTFNGEQKFIFEGYGQNLVTDSASGVACAFKATRGLFNEALLDKLIMTASTGKIPFYKYTGTSGGTMTGLTEVASIDSSGNIRGATEYLRGSLYVGGKTSTTDGKAGVAFGASGNITMQGTSTPAINFITGSKTSAQATISIDTNGWMNFSLADTTITYRTASASTPFFATTGNGTHYLGTSGAPWKTCYAVNGTVQTSDRNQKENIEDINDKYFKFFNLLRPVTYEFIGKDHDRKHVGFVAQEVESAMNEVGLSAIDFGGYCRDKKIEYSVEKNELVNNEGEVIETEKIIEKPIFDENENPKYAYSLRYTEFIALNTKMIQLANERIKTLEEEITQLKAQLKLENS